MAIEGEVAVWLELGSLIVETIIVILLVKTVRDYAEVARMSRLQTEQRFRPWIGPTTGIDLLRTVDGKHQFAIAIKNFGEIPATNVIAQSSTKCQMPKKREVMDSLSLPKYAASGQPKNAGRVLDDDDDRGTISKDHSAEDGTLLDRFVLGPLLPNMEKRYWLFIDSDLMNKAKENVMPLFTFVYFSYEYHGGRSGYGMISQLDPKSGVFVHKEMWVD